MVTIVEGRIKYREDITDGLENAPRELIRLLKGENFGKKIIRKSPDPTAIADWGESRIPKSRGPRRPSSTQAE